MAYKAVTCPQCGAAIASIPNRGSFFCQYCGAKIEKEKLNINVSGNVTVAGMASVSSLLERGFLFLEDGDFNNANKYFERVLDADPKCSRAYLGKLLVDIKCRRPDAELIGYYRPVEKNEFFQKALRYANDDEYDELMSIKQRNIDTYNRILKRSQDDLHQAEQTLEAFNQYYAKHNYSKSKYITEVCLLSLIATVVLVIAIFPVVGIFMEGPFVIPFLIPFIAAGFGFYVWNKNIKKKKSLNEQLEKDKIRLNEEVDIKRKTINHMIREWNR